METKEFQTYDKNNDYINYKKNKDENIEETHDNDNFSSFTSSIRSELKFTNENLNGLTHNYDLIRCIDNNYYSTNPNEFVITIPLSMEGYEVSDDHSSSENEDMKNQDKYNYLYQLHKFSFNESHHKKLYILIKPTPEFVHISYQMNFIPLMSMNFVMNYLRKGTATLINRQLYESPKEFITFYRKFNKINHQKSLTLDDFICIPISMIVFALKLYYIHPSSKAFALLRLLLMIHIKKQSFFNPRLNNKGNNFMIYNIKLI